MIDATGYYRDHPRLRVELASLTNKNSYSNDSVAGDSDNVHKAYRDRYSGDFGYRRRDTSPDLEDIEKLDQELNRKREPLTREQHVICVPMVRAFSLRNKRWLEMEVTKLGNIVWNDDAFATLVLPEGNKDILLALAVTQAKFGQTFDDVISGKGQGMVILLDGPPGSGKTLTVESVAEVMRVPLYSISAGELGIEPASVERCLQKVFKMIKSWKAVLLLDEADVFMQQRSVSDIQRNELVSGKSSLITYSLRSISFLPLGSAIYSLTIQQSSSKNSNTSKAPSS